jgi:hypothetical protein
MVISDEEAAFGGAGRGGKRKRWWWGMKPLGEKEKRHEPRLVTVKLTQLASDRWTNGTRVREAPSRKESEGHQECGLG